MLIRNLFLYYNIKIHRLTLSTIPHKSRNSSHIFLRARLSFFKNDSPRGKTYENKTVKEIRIVQEVKECNYFRYHI
jgi:hypothetical protein